MSGHRRQRSIGAAFHPDRSTHNYMYDAFCVVGLNSTNASINSVHAHSSPQVLARYPASDEPLPFAIVPLCTPHFSASDSAHTKHTATTAESKREPPPLPARKRVHPPDIGGSTTQATVNSGTSDSTPDTVSMQQKDSGSEITSKNKFAVSASLDIAMPDVTRSTPVANKSENSALAALGVNSIADANSSANAEIREKSVSASSGPLVSRKSILDSGAFLLPPGKVSAESNAATLAVASDEPRRHAAVSAREDKQQRVRERSSSTKTTSRDRSSKKESLSVQSPSSVRLQTSRKASQGAVPDIDFTVTAPSPSMFSRLVDSLTPTKKPVGASTARSALKSSVSADLNWTEPPPSPLTPLVRRIRRTDSRTQINEVVFGALANSERSASSFIFLATCDETVYYGSCVVVEELLDSLPSVVTFSHGMAPLSKPSALSESEASQETENEPSSSLTTSADTMHSTHRVYVLVSKFPFFRLHFNVLHSVLARERQLRFESQAKAGTDLGMAGFATAEDAFNASQTIYGMLAHYRNVAVPLAGEMISVHLPDEPRHLEFSLASGPGNDDMLIGDWCLPSLLSALPLPHVMTLLSCALLELPIVVVCANVGTLANIVLSLVPLIKPFIWQGPLVSVLPRSLFSLLQAPVPFICGVLELPRPGDVDECDLSHIVICDVEKQRVLLPRKGLRATLSCRTFPSIEESHLALESFDTLDSISLSRRLDAATEAPALPGLLRMASLTPIHLRFFKREAAVTPLQLVADRLKQGGHRRSRSGGDAIRAMEAAAATGASKGGTSSSLKVEYHEPLHSTERDTEAIREFLSFVRAHMQQVLANIVGQMETAAGDADVVRDEKARSAIVMRQPEAHRLFVEKLMLTQHFSCFVEELRESADQSLLAQLQAAASIEDRITALHHERTQLAAQIADLRERHTLLGRQISSLESTRDSNALTDSTGNRRRKSNVIKASLEALSLTYQKDLSDSQKQQKAAFARE